jgi:hypothetical protein
MAIIPGAPRTKRVWVTPGGYKCGPARVRLPGYMMDVVRRRAEIVAENALLRQQLIAAQRKIWGVLATSPIRRNLRREQRYVRAPCSPS